MVLYFSKWVKLKKMEWKQRVEDENHVKTLQKKVKKPKITQEKQGKKRAQPFVWTGRENIVWHWKRLETTDLEWPIVKKYISRGGKYFWLDQKLKILLMVFCKRANILSRVWWSAEIILESFSFGFKRNVLIDVLLGNPSLHKWASGKKKRVG